MTGPAYVCPILIRAGRGARKRSWHQVRSAFGRDKVRAPEQGGHFEASMRNAEEDLSPMAEDDSTNPDKPELQIGSYRLIEPLGSGGMSSVYRAVHIESGNQVAVK